MAFGNLIISLAAELNFIQRQVSNESDTYLDIIIYINIFLKAITFFVFAALLLFALIIFTFLATRYTYVQTKIESTETKKPLIK